MIIHIWKYNKSTGYWVSQRESHDEISSEQWYRIYSQDEPNEYFYISCYRPDFNPIPKSI